MLYFYKSDEETNLSTSWDEGEDIFIKINFWVSYSFNQTFSLQTVAHHHDSLISFPKNQAKKKKNGLNCSAAEEEHNSWLLKLIQTLLTSVSPLELDSGQVMIIPPEYPRRTESWLIVPD